MLLEAHIKDKGQTLTMSRRKKDRIQFKLKNGIVLYEIYEKSSLEGMIKILQEINKNFKK